MNKYQLAIKLFDTNRDLLERVKVSTVRMSKLNDDVLLLSIGKPINSLAFEMEDGLNVHYDPSSYKVTGFTVVGFTSWYENVHKEVVSNKQLRSNPGKTNEYIDQVAAYGMNRLSFGYASNFI